LVTKAPGDLVVAIVAAHHEKLLVDLRRLWQGVELAWVHPARNEIVAGPVGCRLREDRRLQLEEAELSQILPSSLRQAMPEDQVPLQLRTAKVEIPMPQAQFLRRQLIVPSPRNGNDGCVSGRHQLERLAMHLDRTRRHL